MKTSNKNWVAYVQMANLEPHRGYKILGLVETNHEKYGKGQQAYIVTNNKSKYRTQLPGKYLAQLGPEDINAWKRDTENGHNPYLIFREKMLDGSYRIDVVEKGPEYDDLFVKGEQFPELEDSDASDHEEVQNDEDGEKVQNNEKDEENL